MKKAFRLLPILMLLSIFCSSFLFADSVDDPGPYHVDHSLDRIISAYKIATTGNIPHLAVSVRLLDASETEFQAQGYEINIPENARGTYFGAFSWVVAGNAFQTVNVSFSLGQMSLNGQPTSATNEYIPYNAKLVYGTSRVGNSPIHMNGASTSQNYVENNYAGTTYHMYYADKVTGDIGSTLNSATPKSVSTAPVSFAVAYDMSNYTKVTNTSGQESYTTGTGRQQVTHYYKDDYISAVSVGTQDWQGHTTIPPVCDHWNRIGMAYIMPNITSDGKVQDTKLKTGTYYATVTVEVSIE